MVQATLQSQPNIDSTLLQGITNGLLQTIANCEASASISNKRYEDHLHNLEQHILHYKENFHEPPMGYTLNNGKVSNFHIPVGDRLYQKAKWIHLNDNGTVSGYHSTQGPNEQPHIIDLYAAPDFSIDSPLKALPAWFRHILTGPSGDFQILQQVVADTDNWGLACEVACYHELDNNVMAVAIKIEHYQHDLDAVRTRLASCKSRLMLARTSEQVMMLQNLLRKYEVVCLGWKKGSCAPHRWRMSRDVRGHPS
jgi:hypothetical protein